MRKTSKKNPPCKGSRPTENKGKLTGLTASQRHLLQVLITGTDAEEPSLLAGRP